MRRSLRDGGVPLWILLAIAIVFAIAALIALASDRREPATFERDVSGGVP